MAGLLLLMSDSQTQSSQCPLCSGPCMLREVQADCRGTQASAVRMPRSLPCCLCQPASSTGMAGNDLVNHAGLGLEQPG